MRLLLAAVALSAGAGARQLLSDATREVDGVYFATVDVGTPPKSFTVILDTGSSALALPCANCTTCGPQHKQWDWTQSSSAAPTNETFEQCYLEGSCLRGKLARDTVCLDTACFQAHDVACCDDFSSSAFRTQEADGIFGLGGAFLDSVLALSMCYATSRFSVGFPPRAAEFLWVRNDGLSSPFALRVRSMGGAPVDAYALLDSGSSDIIVPAAFMRRARVMGEICDVAFEGGVSVKLTPCVPLSEISAGKDDAAVSLGAAFFRRVPQIVFTQTHVGFAKSNASACETATSADERADAPWPVLAVGVSYAICVAACALAFYFKI